MVKDGSAGARIRYILFEGGIEWKHKYKISDFEKCNAEQYLNDLIDLNKKMDNKYYEPQTNP